MRDIEVIENDLKRTRKMKKIIDTVFGAIIITGMFVGLAACTIMMQITH